MDLLDDIKERLSVFKNLYDAIRIVNPVEKQIIEVNNGIVKHLDESCYGLWNRNKFCENCTSIRAYIENDTCVKVECKDKSIILIIASPIEYNGETYVLEMLKNISQSGGNNQIINDNEEGIGFLIGEISNKILRDDLTGIYNRRYINERLPVDINGCKTKKSPLSIIMIDIDFFKNVNDTYGHVIGDKVLRDFAALILENINDDTSWTARYGGEEFIVVLNNSDIQEAYEAAEKIRKNLEEKVFAYDDINIKITASLGVYCTENNKISVKDLINEVDKNLYKAKQSGRNITIK